MLAIYFLIKVADHLTTTSVHLVALFIHDHLLHFLLFTFVRIFFGENLDFHLPKLKQQ